MNPPKKLSIGGKHERGGVGVGVRRVCSRGTDLQVKLISTFFVTWELSFSLLHIIRAYLLGIRLAVLALYISWA